MKFKYILLLLLFAIFFIQTSDAQKNLYIRNKRNFDLKIISIGTSTKYRFVGSNKLFSMTLIDVYDSAVVLEGRFDGKEISQRLLRLDTLTSVRKISGFHKVTRWIGGFYMFGGLSVISAGINENPIDELTIVSGSLLFLTASIPFLIHRRDIYLKEKYELVIN